MKIEAFFPYQLAVISAAFSRQLENVYRHEAGLTREEWRMLFLLANAESLTSKEIALRSSLDKVQISRAAQRLIKKRLIVGGESDHDRRLRDYSCTSEGYALFSSLFPRVDSRSDKILAKMPEEDLAALKQGLAALSVAAAGFRKKRDTG